MAFYRFLLYSGVSDGLGVATGRAPASSFRCDSATYAGSKSGCIHDSAIPMITYSISDATVNEVAQHIYDAQVQPDKTVPIVPGKHVPGRTEGPYIHRIYYDTARQARNNSNAVDICRYFWGVNYSQGATKDCDEYPFKSVAEGAANGDNYWSAGPLDKNDNRQAGANLGGFYASQRVLDGDAFAVNIVA